MICLQFNVMYRREFLALVGGAALILLVFMGSIKISTNPSRFLFQRSLERGEMAPLIKDKIASLPVAWNNKNYHQCESVGFPQLPVANASLGSNENFCNFNLFKEYFKSSHTFPGEGVWCKTKNSDDIRPIFVPKMCKFPYTEMPAEVVSQCLASGRIRRIVTIGDSQGGRHHAAMFGVLSKAMDSCEIIKAEHNGRLEINLDPTYLVRTNWTHYDKDKVPKDVNDYGCRVCIGMMRRCTYTTGGKQHTILLEHLRFSNQQPNSAYLNYLFANYLQRDIPVDYIIMVTPLNHLKNYKTTIVQSLASSISSSILKHLPETKLIWVPGPREVEVMKPDKWKNVLYSGSPATKIIQQMNKLIYKKLQTLLEDPRSRVHGFWDFVNISRDVWSTDGIHFIPTWYTKMQQQLLQLICLSQ